MTNKDLDKAITVSCYEQDGIKLCDIPNKLLETNGILTVYTFYRTEDETYTKKTVRFNILARKKPDDYVGEEDAPRWSELEERIDELEQNGVSEETISNAIDEYLTENPIEIPSEYITEEELNVKGYLTEHQSLEGYAKLTDIPTDYAKEEHTHDEYLTQHQDLSAYAKKSDIPSLSGYATEKYVDDAIGNAGGGDVDLTNYYTKDEVNDLFNSLVNGNEVAY